ncbi:MFS transporter [Streptomyces tricolor]|nr:MFS transporter [Streptomyces tricolor]
MPRLIPDARPQRVLAASNFVYTVGNGLYLTAGVLYFTQAARLPADQVGLGLGVAGLVALALGVTVGHLADRYGARGVYAVTLGVQALATAGFVLADAFWPFLLAVCAAAGARTAGTAARSPLIRHYGGDRPQEFRAYLRAVTNVGISLGAVLAGWVVQVGTVTAYQLMVLGNAAAFVVAAVVVVLLPPVAPLPGVDGPRWAALRDRPYLLITGLDGIMAVQFKVLTVGIPLWLVGATTAPALAHLRHDPHQYVHGRRVPGAGQPQHRLPGGRRARLPPGGRRLPRLLFADLADRGDTGVGRRGAVPRRGGGPHGR